MQQRPRLCCVFLQMQVILTSATGLFAELDGLQSSLILINSTLAGSVSIATICDCGSASRTMALNTLVPQLMQLKRLPCAGVTKVTNSSSTPMLGTLGLSLDKSIGEVHAAVATGKVAVDAFSTKGVKVRARGWTPIARCHTRCSPPATMLLLEIPLRLLSSLQTLQDLDAKYRSTSFAVQNTWRLVFLCAVFVTLVLTAMAAGVLAAAATTATSAAPFTLLLCFLTSFMLLFGAGVSPTSVTPGTLPCKA